MSNLIRTMMDKPFKLIIACLFSVICLMFPFTLLSFMISNFNYDSYYYTLGFALSSLFNYGFIFDKIFDECSTYRIEVNGELYAFSFNDFRDSIKDLKHVLKDNFWVRVGDKNYFNKGIKNEFKFYFEPDDYVYHRDLYYYVLCYKQLNFSYNSNNFPYDSFLYHKINDKLINIIVSYFYLLPECQRYLKMMDKISSRLSVEIELAYYKEEV